jgi:hypothetical protein
LGIFTSRGRPYRNERDVITKIYKWFFYHTVKNRRDTIEDSELLEEIWKPDERPILRFRTTREVIFPGYWLVTPNTRWAGLTYQTVKANKEVFVRTETGKRHVSVMVKGQEQVLEVAEDDWKEVEQFLEEIPDPCSHYPST